jgi:adenine-specific DNA-methyltransferase
MMAEKPKPRKVSVDSLKHKDKRKNIPTEELRGFLSEDQQAPKEVEFPGLLYARDPSLDPQLVWTGKDGQDGSPLTVPSVPLYIQEKIHPQALIEDVRAQARKEKPEDQLNLFGDFNGITFEDLIDFYKHDANWSNRMILGDSLLTMTSLAEREGLKGRVQMIYMDPPYGIKFGSNWQVSTRKRDVKDGKAEDATRQPEQIRAFRDTWELGIHSYLAYWRDRLVVARELLTETGSIFVQIGDENVHLVRCLLDEVFGAENFCSLVAVKKTGGLVQDFLPATVDYVVWYAKEKEKVKTRRLYLDKKPGPESGYQYLEMRDGSQRRLGKDEVDGNDRVPDGARFFQPTSLESENPRFDFSFRGRTFSQRWKTTPTGLARLLAADRLRTTTNSLRYVRFLDDFPALPITNIWSDTGSGSFLEPQLYVVQTVTKIVQRCVLLSTDPGDLLLDPTCGSGTTAYVAEQWGRRWITIDTSRVALALARTRLMTARYPYYVLSDTPAGQEKEAELSGVPIQGPTSADVRKGFVCRRVPHVTLKSIANNEEIDSIHARWQEKLEPLRAKLNAHLKQKWEEWEVLRKAEEGWSAASTKLLSEWWSFRKARQEEIDASIARRAEIELLYDQPYDDPKRIRVAGPFTVESLSPHRAIALTPEAGKSPSAGGRDFISIILDNLRTAGVQNTVKKERIKFDRLEASAGLAIQASGEFTDKEGTKRRIAVCIGPEHGTVGPDLIREAAKQAVQGIGHDALVVAGFSFDPHVSEEARQYGKLAVLPTRINADLQLGDEFLKKSGAANLFMVFGEPDLAVRKAAGGRITVEIKGLDIYDPTTGEVRNHATDEIACWFIDTDYNGESFFVRHAYFTGADRPYEKLKRSLRAEIDESAWEALYTTKSRPFDQPKTGKIAVKVINHYGDEVMKVYQVV